LLGQFIKFLIYFATIVGKTLELERLNQVLVLAAFASKALEQHSALLNKTIFFVAKQLLFRDGWHITTRPSVIEGTIESQKLIITPLHFEGTL